jgi:uncharacterized protein YacL
MGRSILAVVAGLVLGVVLIFAVESLGHFVYPPPSDLDMTNPEALKNLMANAPVGALLFVILAYVIGSFGGGWLAARLAQKSHVMHSLIVGGLLMAAGIMNMLMIPHPTWFWIISLVLYLPAAYAGALLGQKRQT